MTGSSAAARDGSTAAGDESAAAHDESTAARDESAADRNESTAPENPPATPDRWTILSMIRWATDYLEGKGVQEARLDAEHLLAESLGVERLQLYLQFERPLTPEELAAFKPLLLRRAGREPLQYILGRTPFREIELKTDERALIPRPETEVLVQVILDRVAGRAGLSALDLGTGTGAIALSLAVEGDFARIVATDVSAAALDLARENATALESARENAAALEGGPEDAEAPGSDGPDASRVEVEFREGDLFGALAEGETFHVIVSNPPYVEETERTALQPEVAEWEPEGALFAGPGGLDVIERIVSGAPAFLAPGGLLALEVGEGQAEEVRDRIASNREYKESNIRRDLSGRARFVIAERV